MKPARRWRGLLAIALTIVVAVALTLIGKAAVGGSAIVPSGACDGAVTESAVGEVWLFGQPMITVAGSKPVRLVSAEAMNVKGVADVAFDLVNLDTFRGGLPGVLKDKDRAPHRNLAGSTVTNGNKAGWAVVVRVKPLRAGTWSMNGIVLHYKSAWIGRRVTLDCRAAIIRIRP